MSKGTLIKPIPGILRTLSAAEEATLDERGIPTKLGRQYRRVQVASDGYNADAHTVSMAVSSETPVERYYGQEILSHAKGAIRTNRLKGGVSLLFNHNYDALLGRSTDYKLTDGGPLTVTARFGPSALAQEKEGEVAAGVLVDVSIGYIVHEWEIVEDKNGNRTYTAVDWELLEASLVTVPADPTVGVGRAADAADSPIKVRSFTRAADDEQRAMASGGNAGDATNVTEVGQPKKKKRDGEDDDDDDADDEEERSAESSAAQTSTTQTTEQRTNTMAEATTTATTTVDLAAANQERITGLRQLHAQYPNEFNKRSLEAAEGLGVSVASASERIADAIINASQRTNVATVGDEISDTMSEREVKQYSLRNALAYAVNQVKPGTFTDKGAAAGFEREIGETLQKRAEERGVTGFGGNIVIPGATSRLFARQAAQRTLSSGGNAGTYTNVTEVVPEPIELLRSRTAVLALGARMMTGLFGTIKMPRQTGAATSNWEAEGSSATDSNPTLDAISLSPSRLSLYNSYYRELLLQSALSVDSFLSADRLAVLARALDTACIAGSGTAPVPLGLLNQSGLTAVLSGTTRATNGTVTAGLGGVPPTFVDYNNMEAAISTANGDIGTLRWLSTPKIRAAGRSIPQIPGSAVSGFTWPNSKVGANGLQEGPLGYDALVTSNSVLTGFTANSVNNLHAIILGVWDQMLIGDWGLSEVIVDPYTGAQAALYKITEHAFYGTAVRHLESFCANTSALPS